MDDSQTTHDNLPLTLITRESLPKSPGIYDTRRKDGRYFGFQVPSFPLLYDEALKWAEDHDIGIGKKPHTRRDMALPAILDRLPVGCQRISLIHVKKKVEALSVVVATNKNAEDLARADDLEMLQEVQRVMGTSRLPVWYFPQE